MSHKIANVKLDVNIECAEPSKNPSLLRRSLSSFNILEKLLPGQENDERGEACKEVSKALLELKQNILELKKHMVDLKEQVAHCNDQLKELVRPAEQHEALAPPPLLPVSIAMAGDVMGHASKIADLMSQELGQRGRAAIMKTSPVTASDAHGLWVIRLHRVPSRLQVDAILQDEGAAPRSRTILILLHNKSPVMRVSDNSSEAQCKTDPVAWTLLTAAFAAVTEMFFREDELLECSHNEAAIDTAVSIIVGHGA